MDLDEIARRRLAAQRLAGPPHDRAEDAVRSLLAVQAQDRRPAAWSVAMRTGGLTADGFDRVFDDGRVVRTCCGRPGTSCIETTCGGCSR